MGRRPPESVDHAAAIVFEYVRDASERETVPLSTLAVLYLKQVAGRHDAVEGGTLAFRLACAYIQWTGSLAALQVLSAGKFMHTAAIRLTQRIEF